MAKLSTLIDDFQDNVINTSLWNADAGIAETGGKLVITPSVLSPIFSSDITTYDVTASHIIANVTSVPPAGTTGSLTAAMVITDNPDNQAAIQKFGTDLRAVKLVGGIQTTVASFAYNAVTMAYWRMREEAGIFYWEVSSTGTTGSWASLFNTSIVPNLFPVTSVGVYFYAEFVGAEASPGTFALESVNPGLQITASGASTSTGTARIFTLHRLTSNAASTSAGSAVISIPPPSFFAMTASGSSTSTGTASFITLTPGQMTASGISYSAGSAALQLNYQISAVGQSFSNGAAVITVYVTPPFPVNFQYYTFEPPIVYDLPATLPGVRPSYINAYAKWKKGGPRGRSVLRTGNTVTLVDTPTIDQMAAADYVYQGGHIYTITNLEADVLAAAGLTVVPIPIGFTLYPALNIYPSPDLYPSYQDLSP